MRRPGILSGHGNGDWKARMKGRPSSFVRTPLARECKSLAPGAADVVDLGIGDRQSVISSGRAISRVEEAIVCANVVRIRELERAEAEALLTELHVGTL